MKTLIGYYDRVWYDAESNDIAGDMGFSFCDSGESRFPATDEQLAKSIVDTQEYHCRGCYDYEIGDGVNEDFAIYELHTAIGECEDDTEIGIKCADLDMDTDKVVAVFVCATKEDADAIVQKHYGKDIKAYYII